MDIATFVGIGLALFAVVGGNYFEGGAIGALVQPTAALIVVGGTIGATIAGSPLQVFIKAVKAAKEAFFDKGHVDSNKLIDEIASYAQQARRDGLIALEKSVENASHPFLKKALMMAIDGADSKQMRTNLELMLQYNEEAHEKSAKVWEGAGGYAPTLGIIGAVMGLIKVMQNLSDIALVGEGIAVAFVATIYGLVMANVFCLPFANKLKIKSREEMIQLELMLEGALAIQEGFNPNFIKDKLSAFLSESDKDQPT